MGDPDDVSSDRGLLMSPGKGQAWPCLQPPESMGPWSSRCWKEPACVSSPLLAGPASNKSDFAKQPGLAEALPLCGSAPAQLGPGLLSGFACSVATGSAPLWCHTRDPETFILQCVLPSTGAQRQPPGWLLPQPILPCLPLRASTYWYPLHLLVPPLLGSQPSSAW